MRKEVGSQPSQKHKAGEDDQEKSRPPQEHGGVSLPGVTFLGEEGGPTIIGEGRVSHHIPHDDEWYDNMDD